MPDTIVGSKLRLKERILDSPQSTIVGLAAVLVGGVDSVPPEILEYVTGLFRGGDHRTILLHLIGAYLIWRRDAR